MDQDYEEKKRLDLYILDFFIKNGMHNTARIFMMEANIDPRQSVIFAPKGFLLEWWIVFWEMFRARIIGDYSKAAETYILMTSQEHQNKLSMELPQDCAQIQYLSATVNGFTTQRLPNPSTDETLADVMYRELMQSTDLQPSSSQIQNCNNMDGVFGINRKL